MADEILSKQPRFSDTENARSRFLEDFGVAILRSYSEADLTPPAYSSDSRELDLWLTQFWPREPHLAGVVNDVTVLDKNRGWFLTGTADQVNLFKQVIQSMNGGVGYRTAMSQAAQAYYTTNMGYVGELGREGDEEGPLRAIWNVDPTICKLTGKNDYPLRIDFGGGDIQYWKQSDYMRISSMPNIVQKFNGLGYCAVARAAELARILVAVYQHDQEQLFARAPRGLLLLKGLTEVQWDDAMQSRDARLDSIESRFYGALSILASDTEIDAKLLALSQLPRDFDMQMFTNMVMFAYALVFGYDPREFWPVSSGALGTSLESEVQHRKATGKGGLDFVLAFQEWMSRLLPPTVAFEFAQRDADGELIDAKIMATKAAMIRELFEARNAKNEVLVEKAEARQLLAEQGIIHYEWTEAQEAAVASDVMMARQLDAVHRARFEFPSERIVRYHWPTNRTVVVY